MTEKAQWHMTVYQAAATQGRRNKGAEKRRRQMGENYTQSET